MLIHAAAHSDAFKAIVSEGASGQSIRDGLANGDRLDAYLGGGLNTLAVAVFTNTLPPPSLKSEMPKLAPTAVFLIYGEKGQNGSETKPNKLFYAAAREPKQIWEVPNGQHIAGITTEPTEYERRVVGFFDRTLREKQVRRDRGSLAARSSPAALGRPDRAGSPGRRPSPARHPSCRQEGTP